MLMPECAAGDHLSALFLLAKTLINVVCDQLLLYIFVSTCWCSDKTIYTASLVTKNVKCETKQDQHKEVNVRECKYLF